VVYLPRWLYNPARHRKGAKVMRRRIFLFSVPLVVLLVCLWLFFRSGGEAVLLFTPPEDGKFKVRWSLTLTDSVGLGGLGRTEEHSHDAEAELLIRRMDDGYRLRYGILEVDDVRGAFSAAPKAGETVDVVVDEKGGIVMSQSKFWLPPFIFSFVPFLNGRRTRAGEEWSVERKVSIPRLGGVVVEFRMRLVSAPFSVAYIEGKITKPKVVHLLHLAMEVVDSGVEVEFDKRNCLIRYIRLYGLLESVSGGRVLEFDASMVCEPYE